MDLPPPSPSIWVYPKRDPEWVDRIVKEFSIHPITAQILVSRGFDTLEKIHHYLYSQLPDLVEPSLFLDMAHAVTRICLAIDKKEKLLIYGDNDVDGMTGCALLADFFKRIGANVDYLVPNPNLQRKELYSDALAYAKEIGATLIITVDCGITAAKEIQKINDENIDVIVTDHHEPTDKIPNCIATLNPKLHNQTYPNRELTGVGVAFKLAHAVTNHLVSNKHISPKKIDLKVYLDLVALGTIADMGVLLGENRILVRYGLKQLRKTKRIGLVQLFAICGFDRADLSTIDVASKVAPRLNSLGRVADPRKGVELLLVRDEVQAVALAKELDLFNIERQKVEQKVAVDVDLLLKSQPEIFSNKAIIISSNKWHPGVIPIISARIAKQYNRPTCLISILNGIGKGSIRTIREFPLLPVLKNCADLLINYGGHDFAAGLTIKEENIERFKKRFVHAANSALRDQDIISKLYLDAEANFDELNYDLLSSLELFEPYGNENMQPILFCQAMQTWMPKVISNTHLKLYLEQGDRMLEGIAFGMAARRSELLGKNVKVQLAFTPQINRFQNKSSIQLLIRDFQVIG